MMPKAAVAKKPAKEMPPSQIAVLTEKKPVLVVDIDWANLPILQAQSLYATLKFYFEKAGSILNARTTGSNAEWVCYMSDKGNDCPTKGQLHNTLPKSVDLSHVNPATGLTLPVRLCSELCHIRYQAILINERREKYAPKRGE